MSHLLSPSDGDSSSNVLTGSKDSVVGGGGVMCNLSDFDDPSEDLEEDQPPTLVPMPPRLAAHQFQSMTSTVSEESARSSPRSGMVNPFFRFLGPSIK